MGSISDFSGANPVIYATTMENGAPTNYPGGFGVNTQQGHQNNNRIIMLVDTGVSPGTNYVAQTLAVAPTTNGFFGGIDFTPDLRPLITSNPSSYSTTNGGNAAFSVTDQCGFPATFQWLENSTNAPEAGGTSPTLTLSNVSTNSNVFVYQCVVSDQYGSVTSTPAVLTVTATPVALIITSPTNHVTSFINGTIAFGAVTATGTQPFSYQWYFGTTQLIDGPKYTGSTSPSMMISNLAVPGDSGNYYVVVSNSAGYASNLADVLTVKYFPVSITPGQPSSVTTFMGLTTSLTANSSGGTAPITNQWYKGATALTDTGDYSGTTTPTLTISPAHTNDTASNYYIVVSNPAGSVTSSVASVTVVVPPPLSSVSYSNQVYFQTFDSLPDPGGVSVNSFNNPGDPGNLNGVAYSLANPFDFNYPVILQSYVGGLGLSAMKGWYGAADTLYTGVDGITRFGAQEGDQSTGGVIDFGPNDVNGGVVGTNRALGLISTSTTGSTSFGLKLINTSGLLLNYIDVSFIGEYWRNNSGARTMSFGYTYDIGATNFVLTSEAISNCTPVDALSFSFTYDPLGNLNFDGTQSSNQLNLAVSNLALSTPWNPGDALWLIWSIEYYGAGGGQGYAIDNLAFAASVNPVTAPVATTTAASAVTAGSAVLNGAVNPSNAPTAYWFEYGTTTAYGKFSSTNVLAPGSSTISVSNSITGLLQGTGYHYQLVATNFAGVSLGGEVTLTTLPVTPPDLGGVGYGGGKFSLSFTNATGASFSVLGTNSLTVPLNKWPVVGHTVENPIGSGMYYYTNSSATNAPFFYRLRQP